MGRGWIPAAGLAAVLALAACDPVTSPVPGARPPAPAPQAPATQSAQSKALESYFARVQQSLVTQGLLRTDGGGPDVPFNARMLTANFEQIALFEEYTIIGGRLVAQPTPSRLHRWKGPVRFELEFGATVAQAKQRADRAEVARFAQRLAKATRHPVTTVPDNGNFHVFIVNEDERRALGPRLRQLLPGIGPAALDSALNMGRATYCAVFAVDPRDDGNYTRAVAIIRAEHPDLLRKSCIHEELAQGLGLANDSPAARPSIFNDDEEFALLTYHDELLLRILYDSRLRAGMTASEARPIVRTIAEELLGADS
ncbi:DUF2927 domain-containing protein [Aliiroseovarius sp. PTFE2010]|uniref:DUF2927 domain-containing protein n=1 Tax=Aliiroseovarius sp. PTFE2010 TaxID=3417190 RepID=UPI003CE93EE7